MWLSAYKKSDEERLALLIRHFSDSNQELCTAYSKFIQTTAFEKKRSSWQAFDYLMSVLDNRDFSDRNVALDILDNANSILPKTCVRLLSNFCLYLGKDDDSFINIEFVSPRVEHKYGDEAYTFQQYTTMAWFTFNEAAIQNGEYIKKAAENLWAFIAIHFLSAIRSSDIRRLPQLVLPVQGADIREQILNGTMSIDELSFAVNSWLTSLEAFPLVPQKTRDTDYVPDISICVPTSLYEIVGKIFALCSSWKGPDEPLISHFTADSSELRRFFGDDFCGLFPEAFFSNRKANKSYLQGLERIADIVSGSTGIQGYMVAALARSHKGSFHSFPQSTEFYLKDASFNRYSEGVVAREMFERGLFGFIPAILIKAYEKDGWGELDIHSQTALIQSLGITAVQIESVAGAVRNSLEKCCSAILEVFQENVNPEKVGAAIQRLCETPSPKGHNSCLCFRAACNLACCHTERKSCYGCGYEVYTRTAVFQLAKECKRQMSLMETESSFEQERHYWIIQNVLLPSITSIQLSIHAIHPDDNLDYLARVINEVLPS